MASHKFCLRKTNNHKRIYSRFEEEEEEEENLFEFVEFLNDLGICLFFRIFYKMHGSNKNWKRFASSSIIIY